jgi:hypothetical protein
VSTRTQQTLPYGAASNRSLRDQRTTERDPGGPITKAATISFTAPGTIADSGNGFGWARAGSRIEVRGSALNSRTFVVATASAASVTVLPAVVTSEAAGPSIIVAQVP